MRPLELRTYRIWDSLGTLYADNPRDPRMPFNVDYEVYRKRLTDTELAAEYWKASERAAFLSGRSALDAAQVWGARAETLRRFATTPHATEETP